MLEVRTLGGGPFWRTPCSGRAAGPSSSTSAKLGPEEYERRLLRCGDAYGFQGDERDVVFISVVSDGEGAPSTSRRYEQ